MNSKFFRAASEDTSTSYDDESLPSSSQGDHTPNERGSNGHFEIINRIETLDSGQAGPGSTPATIALPLPPNQRLRQDLLLHALLEEKFLSDAREELGGDGRVYSKDDPEVKALAEQKYRHASHVLISSNMIPPRPEKLEDIQMRHTIRHGLDYLSRQSSTLNQHSLRGSGGSSTALALYGNGLPSSRSTSPALPRDFSQVFQQMRLRSSSPDVWQVWLDHPFLDSTRYTRSFQELGLLGKGGYGKVYHVKHTLDKSEYAVKKVPLNASRVARIRERGQAELDVLLAELVALAKLDHPNIVRYHSGWLEYCIPDPLLRPSRRVTHETKLIEGPGTTRNSSRSSGSNNVFHQREDSLRLEHSMTGASQIVFESSERSGLFGRTSSHHRNRSLDSALQLAPRRGMKPLPSKLAYEPCEMVEQQESFSIKAESASSTNISVPHLVLHVQMAVYTLSLSDYLMPSSPGNAIASLRHCFHLQMSLQIFLEILDGVEYLHKLGMVHRDLKPSNIFMSIKSQPAHKHLDLGTCSQCGYHSNPTSGPFLNLRIGDFGLVAEIARPESAAFSSKAVGTELYRPPAPEAIHESLDVYALGVLAFELLCPFETRMERHNTLQLLKQGVLPENFMSSYGEEGSRIVTSIMSMVNSDPQMRPSCAEIRAAIGNSQTPLKVDLTR